MLQPPLGSPRLQTVPVSSQEPPVPGSVFTPLSMNDSTPAGPPSGVTLPE